MRSFGMRLRQLTGEVLWRPQSRQVVGAYHSNEPVNASKSGFASYHGSLWQKFITVGSLAKLVSEPAAKVKTGEQPQHMLRA